MRRFVLPPGTPVGSETLLSGDLYRHAVKVLRLKIGAQVLLVDGTGREFHGTLGRIDKGVAVVEITGGGEAPLPEVGPRITVYQGLPKGDKLELVLQKCTELGASAIIPFVAERSVVRLKEEQRQERVARWHRIAAEAARQSGRRTVPDVALALNLEELLITSRQSLKLLLWEDEQGKGLKEAVLNRAAPEDVALFVGPEGGFTTEEVEKAIAGGFTPVSLGSRILRTETAAMAVLAILQFQWGDLG